jgi:hypothetical protein
MTMLQPPPRLMLMEVLLYRRRVGLQQTLLGEWQEVVTRLTPSQQMLLLEASMGRQGVLRQKGCL